MKNQLALIITLAPRPRLLILDEPTTGFDPVKRRLFLNAIYHSQWVAKNLLQVGVICAIVLGMGVVAGEKAYGTSDFLFSRPVTRREIYTTKVAAGLSMLFVCIIGSSLIVWGASILKGHNLDVGLFWRPVIICLSGLVLVYLTTAVLSVLGKEPIKVGIVSALFWIVLSIPGFFEHTAVYSVFFHMKGISHVIQGQNMFIPVLAFLGVSLLMYEVGVHMLRGEK